MTDTPVPHEAVTDRLTVAEIDLLAQAYTLLMAHLPAERNSDEFIELGRAVYAGAPSARNVILSWSRRASGERRRLDG